MTGASFLIQPAPYPMLRRVTRFSPWTLGTVLLALLAATPVVTVVWLAVHPSDDIWQHLLDTSLLVYLSNTLLLMLGVGVSVLLTGVATAWLVTMCRFPGRSQPM